MHKTPIYLSDGYLQVPHEEVEEVEVMAIPVQETPLTTCPPPSTAASIANLEYPEEPLPTAASVASEECLEPLPMALTVSSYECLDVPRTDDSNFSLEQTSVVCWVEQLCLCSVYLYVYMTVTMHVFCLLHCCVPAHVYVCMHASNLKMFSPGNCRVLSTRM